MVRDQVFLSQMKIALVVMSFLGNHAWAVMPVPQEGKSTAAERITRLVLGSTSAAPGNSVYISLVIDVSEGLEVGKVISETTFPGQVIFFKEAIGDLSVRLAQAEVSAMLEQDEAHPGYTILRVIITSREGRTIPSGMLANLQFDVSDDAPIGETFKLEHQVQVLTTEDPPTIVDSVVATDGEITISANPFFACFFYMH